MLSSPAFTIEIKLDDKWGTYIITYLLTCCRLQKEGTKKLTGRLLVHMQGHLLSRDQVAVPMAAPCECCNMKYSRCFTRERERGRCVYLHPPAQAHLGSSIPGSKRMIHWIALQVWLWHTPFASEAGEFRGLQFSS